MEKKDIDQCVYDLVGSCGGLERRKDQQDIKRRKKTASVAIVDPERGGRKKREKREKREERETKQKGKQSEHARRKNRQQV